MSPADVAALPGWRWMPGMRSGPWRLIRQSREGRGLWVCAVEDVGPWSHTGLTTIRPDAPDRDDPATLGCLLALVREAWGDPMAHLAPYSTRVPGPSGDLDQRAWWWRLYRADGTPYEVPHPDGGGGSYFAGPTEWDALAAALAAAPGVTRG